MKEKIYRFLDRPWLYRAAQRLLAPGAGMAISREARRLLDRFRSGGRLLDVGCGPVSFLAPLGLAPMGADLSREYVRCYQEMGGTAVVARAESLPFSSQSFDGVWTLGLFHHLPDDAAAAAVRELLRVCRKGGHVALLDAVLPDHAWTRPVASLIRRMDRGEHMRRQAALEALLPDRSGWMVRRRTYSLTGLELLICVKVKGEAD